MPSSYDILRNMESPNIMTEDRARAFLSRHRVTEDEYLAWAAGRIARRTRRVGVVLSLALSTFIISTVAKLAVASDLTASDAVKLSGIALIILTFTLGIALWMHANSVNPLAEGMLHLELKRWCTPAFLAELEERDWSSVRKLAKRTNTESPPDISHETKRRVERLTPWRRLAGWFSVTLFALSLFGSRNQPAFDLLLSVFFLATGTYFCLHGAQLWMARQYEDRETGAWHYGGPAVLMGAASLAFGGALVLLGAISLAVSVT